MSALPAHLSWVLDGGWYANNPGAQKLAIARALMPVTHEHERRAAKSFTPAPSHSCIGCGRFAVANPRGPCFWCKRGAQ